MSDTPAPGYSLTTLEQLAEKAHAEQKQIDDATEQQKERERVEKTEQAIERFRETIEKRLDSTLYAALRQAAFAVTCDDHPDPRGILMWRGIKVVFDLASNDRVKASAPDPQSYKFQCTRNFYLKRDDEDAQRKFLAFLMEAAPLYEKHAEKMRIEEEAENAPPKPTPPPPDPYANHWYVSHAPERKALLSMLQELHERRFIVRNIFPSEYDTFTVIAERVEH